MEPLSVFMITKNEEKRLPATLEAIKDLADEIIILDSGSTDKTEEIAKRHGAKFSFREFEGFGQQKVAAQKMCKNDWVLNIDADEVLEDNLKSEIESFLQETENTSAFDGGAIHITSILPGEDKPRPLARSYNRIRLYNKKKLSFPAHSTFDNIDFDKSYKIHQFQNIIKHYSYLSLEDLEAKARERTQFYFEEEKQGNLIKNLLRLPFEFINSFIKCYFFRKHFASGWYGLRNAYIYAKYRHIRILQRVLGKCLIK